MRSLCGADWSPAKVELTRPKPADVARYKGFFRSPVVFGARNNALSFSKNWLSVPVSTSDGEKHKMLSLENVKADKNTKQGVSPAVRRLLHRNVSRGIDGSRYVAESLGIHERTLRRRLARENTSFRELLEEVRETLSLQYLNDTELSISDIAFALGYSGTDAFDHAFRRWHGMSPSQWRRRQVSSNTS
jgi:AraC-like DNA-binding protein